MADKKTPEEAEWIAKIESLRGELNRDPTRVTVIDYGAGSPGSHRTEEEMLEGVPVTRTIDDICLKASKPYTWALLLFRLVREFRPSVCLELGTCLGISTAYQAAALTLNRGGRIITLEGAQTLADLARKNFERLALGNIVLKVGRFQDTLGQVLKDEPRIDFAFIDGHHDEHATLGYFEQLYPCLSEAAIVVFDNINWSSGMKRAWRTIAADQRITLSVDLFWAGVCLLSQSGPRIG
ncbi:MAG: class I SAM-dependent methyltransferase, partial [Planctomycetes bacterium]|nr:class I SAM-dependent methyltransferase [Planctomycetota bacterium]